MRSSFRSLRSFTFVLLWGLFGTARAQDGIEGRWLADLGPSDNRTQIALLIARDAQGALSATFTNTLLNFYRVALPPLERADAGHYRIARFDVSMRLQADRLTVSGLINEPVELRRTTALPEPPQRPEPPAGPAPRWQVRLGGAIFAPVVLHDGALYVGNTDGVMFALDARDGSRIWTFSAGRPIHGEALVTADAVYFVCDNGYLYKLERSSGKEVWRYDLGDERIARVPPNPFVFDYEHQAPRPALADGTLYVGSADASFHAVNAQSGERVWRVAVEGKVRTSAAVQGPLVAFGTLGNRVYVLERANGRERRRFVTQGPVTSMPTFADTHFIIGDRGSELRALHPDREQPLWSQPYWGSWVESSAVLHDGTAYIGSGDLFLVSALDPQNGRNRWRTHVGAWVVQRPAVTDSHVYVSLSGARRRAAHFMPQAGGLAVLDRNDGRIVWRWSMPTWPGAFLHGFFAAPVLSSDSVLVGGVDGSLYAFPRADAAR